MRRKHFFALLAVLLAGTAAAVQVVEYKSGIIWPEPPVIDPGQAGRPPSDAVVLFGGQNLDAWEGGDKWIVADDVATSAGGTITSKQKFGGCQLHVEFATPAEVKGSGQGRGNSGIYLMSRYEVQILDSYDNKTYFDGQCGAIYKEQPPTVNACRKPGEWQTYDILFTAPRFHEDGTVMMPGYVTVLHNGVVIHNHFELLGATSYTEPARYVRHGDKEPLQIQFHGNPMKFRNIWIRENIKPLAGLNPDPRPNSRP
jgi:3-keto-disaccharide hydrolase